MVVLVTARSWRQGVVLHRCAHRVIADADAERRRTMTRCADVVHRAGGESSSTARRTASTGCAARTARPRIVEVVHPTTEEPFLEVTVTGAAKVKLAVAVPGSRSTSARRPGQSSPTWRTDCPASPSPSGSDRLVVAASVSPALRWRTCSSARLVPVRPSSTKPVVVGNDGVALVEVEGGQCC